jgi:arylsulfatase A-like enzyme/Tfp pilus assembly protein PilF
MLTGLYPPEHGLRVNGMGRLERQIPLLPEILKKHGYETGAFVAAAVLDSQYGLDRGFDTYDDSLPRKKFTNHFGEPRRDGQDVVESAIAWLKQRTTRPFFCWIHLYDAHGPYDSRPEIFGEKFVEQPYDAGIAREVQQFERVTRFLKETKLDLKTLVIVAGDHGEGLLEHQESEHGMLIYNSTLRVPLVVAGPRLCQPGTRVRNAVSLVDLTPTLLDVLRITPPKHTSGRSLLAALKGQAIGSQNCYAETETPFMYNHWAPLRTLISDRWKYIQTTRPELYDLKNDPGELMNLTESAVEESENARNLLSLLEATFIPATAHNLQLPEKDLLLLQSLGYLSGGNPARNDQQSKKTEALRDVKDMLPQLVRFDQARHFSMEDGKLEEAIALLQEIVQATKEFPAAGVLLGDCLAQSGRFDGAVAMYRSVLAQRPEFANVHSKLGKIYSRQGHLDQAVVEFSEFLQVVPESASCHFELGLALTQLQKFNEAIAQFREAIRISPEFVVANVALGQLLLNLKQPHPAQKCFEQAIAYDPSSVVAHANLFLVLAQTGQNNRALEQGARAIALDPNSFENRYNFGAFLVAQQLYSDGISQLREAQKLRPDDPRPLQQIQQAQEAMKRSGR